MSCSVCAVVCVQLGAGVKELGGKRQSGVIEGGSVRVVLLGRRTCSGHVSGSVKD